MTEDATTQTDPANQQATPEGTDDQSQAGREITIKHNREEISLPEDQIVELAQKGFDYKSKLNELGEQRRQVEEQASEFDQMKQFKNYLDSNPEKAARIAAIIEGEE